MFSKSPGLGIIHVLSYFILSSSNSPGFDVMNDLMFMFIFDQEKKTKHIIELMKCKKIFSYLKVNGARTILN